jgi:hypothetical protein
LFFWCWLGHFVAVNPGASGRGPGGAILQQTSGGAGSRALALYPKVQVEHLAGNFKSRGDRLPHR